MNVLRYIQDNWDTLGPQAVTQLEIVGIVMAAATALGLMLGVVAARSERFSVAILAVTSTILTIPSFALFGILSIWLGLGNPPVIAGLILYALLPVTRNTRAGILAVAPAIVEAARGMGMSSRQVLTRVELPLAVPVIIAGVRQATVMVVAIATVGAAIGVNDLGQPIFAALGRSFGAIDPILAAVIPIALIGILADLLLAGAQRLLSTGRVTVGAT